MNLLYLCKSAGRDQRAYLLTIGPWPWTFSLRCRWAGTMNIKESYRKLSLFWIGRNRLTLLGNDDTPHTYIPLKPSQLHPHYKLPLAGSSKCPQATSVSPKIRGSVKGKWKWKVRLEIQEVFINYS